jgi:hypothetical protein
MFVQILSMMRNNMWLVQKCYYEKHNLNMLKTHKQFTLEMIEHLWNKAKIEDLPSTEIMMSPETSNMSQLSFISSVQSAYSCQKSRARRRLSASMSLVELASFHQDTFECKKKLRLRNGLDELERYPQRLTKPSSLHVHISSGSQRMFCVYCRMKYWDDERGQKDYNKVVKKCRKKCSLCNVFLCNEHFGVFHGENAP